MGTPHLHAALVVGMLLVSGPAAAEGPGTIGQSRPCLATMDRTRMESIVPCFYEVGGLFLYPGPFSLLSTESAALLRPDSHVESISDFTVVSAKVVGIEEVRHRRFARVSVRHRRGACEVTATQTWVEEKGGWRRIWLPLTDATARKQNSETGKIPELLATLNDWLEKDPFALYPLTELADLLHNGPQLVEYKLLDRLPVSRHGTLDQLVKRALKINPEDDHALYLAIRRAASLREARTHFARIPRGGCVWALHAAALVRRFTEPRELVAFSAELKDDSPALVDSIVRKLIELEDARALQEYLTPDRTSIVRRRWEERSKQDKTAFQAALLAVVLLKLPDHSGARAWRDHALKLEPGNRIVEVLFTDRVW